MRSWSPTRLRSCEAQGHSEVIVKNKSYLLLFRFYGDAETQWLSTLIDQTPLLKTNLNFGAVFHI